MRTSGEGEGVSAAEAVADSTLPNLTVQAADAEPLPTTDTSWVVPFASSSARTVRTDITVELRRCGVVQRTIDDARIVASELLGNALRYAEPLATGGLGVCLQVQPNWVRIAVSDGGSMTLPALLHSPMLAPGGRGLAIVNTLASTWGVQERSDGNTVFGVLQRHLS